MIQHKNRRGAREYIEEAHNQHWITIWIHPNSHLSSNHDFVDYAFPDIITALIHFNKKAKRRAI